MHDELTGSSLPRVGRIGASAAASLRATPATQPATGSRRKNGYAALRASLALATTLFLAACAVGPDFVKPTTAAPERFAQAGTSVAAQPAAVDTAFWHGFNDPLLSRLVDDALDANHDLRIALSRYDRANALLRGAKFDYLPTITAQGEAAD